MNLRPRKEPRAGDRLPYARLLGDHAVVLRDGSILQVLHLEGFAFETADTGDLNQKQAIRDAALRAVGNSRYVVHHHILRRRVEVALDGEFADPVCAEIDAHWQARLTERRLFVNDLFVTLLRRAPKGKIGVADRLAGLLSRGLDAQTRSAALARDLRELDGVREALQAALQPYGPRLLGGYDTPNGRCSEPLEFLSALYNGEMRPVLAPAGDVGHHLPYRRITFGHEAIERKGAAAAKDFSAILSLKEYPPSAAPGVLDALLRLPYEMTLSEAFAFVDRQIGVERVSLALRRFRAADDDSQSLRRGLVEAKDDLTSGRSALGEHQLSILVRAASLDQLDGAVAECAATFADLGAIAVREDLALEPAFWAQFPGNEAYAARKAQISTGAFASLASLHGFPIGRASDNHWGPAITVLETTSATPYFFNLHDGDLGNFTIIGPSGSGKTVVLNFLAAQAQKIRPRTIFFDKDRGAEIFLRSIGGHYANLRPGQPTGFNPLQLPDSPSSRAFLRSWVARLACRAEQALTPDEEQLVAQAVDANFEQEPLYRRLRYFRELLGGFRRPEPGDLASRIAPWCGEGQHAWLFDNAYDRLDLGQATLGFDMTELLEDPTLRTPAMMYLFHRVEERLDGSPTLILIDEGWKALDDEVFAARIRDWMKTLRKRNAVLGFGSQSARDALDSRISSAILEQAATQIFMPNPRAQAADYCGGFGLTEHELSLVQGLPPRSRCFLVKHGAHSVVARLDLSSMPDLLTVLSGREASVRKLDEIRRRVGDHPAFWWPELVGGAYPAPLPDVAALPLRSAS
ncbi:VirB4 family type IV secretion system protein [Phenylobacterium sp. LjRoot225]|uniref:VirB4 family type IV secretion/conjugal transfer ATPase n=1 Tax=Phenylobacterium sp. LjRoot225 TaxID=3342285 RepID=UPI003ECDE807